MSVNLRYCIYILGLFCHLRTDCIAQNNKNSCGCDVILLPKGRKVALRDLPAGKVITTIENDTVSENYFTLSVVAIKNNWSKVEAYSPLDTGKVGWVENKNLGIYTRNYSSKFRLYSKADKKSHIKSIINNWYPDPWHVLGCKNKWLYVIYYNGRKKYKGWLEPEMQCANAYTTCN